MTGLQYRFLDMLDEFGYDIFNIKMIRDTGYFSDKGIMFALKSLARSGIIQRIERGKYVKSSYVEEYVIGNFLAPDGGIAYWSALNSLGLTEQFANVIFIQTAKRRGQVVFRNLRYKFVKVGTHKLFGYKDYGYGNHRYRMTDVEKTIVDSFDLPQYSGWYQETIKAFNNAKLSARKLTLYCRKIDNISVTKRLGFLCELLKKPNMEVFIDYARSAIGNGYSLFEIDGENKGVYNERWKLIINMPVDEILEIANS